MSEFEFADPVAGEKETAKVEEQNFKQTVEEANVKCESGKVDDKEALREEDGDVKSETMSEAEKMKHIEDEDGDEADGFLGPFVFKDNC